ncbi:hypothetical protein HK098_004527 [Nowakowskiella sp. JEL0407]|nr:hypothetical protein HK098_004527 [Nowakowskiella sp. JEL0407]
MDDASYWQTEYQRQFTWSRLQKHPQPHPLSQQQQPEFEVQQPEIEITETGIQVSPFIESESPESVPEIPSPIIEKQEPVSTTSKPRSRKPTSEPDLPKKQGESKQEQQEEEILQRPKTPNIIPYGNGNTHTLTDKTYMKTFNVNAPSSEIYPYTTTRSLRTYSYNPQSSLTRLQSSRPNQPPLSKSDALQSYITAQKLLDVQNSRFQTEYQREFLNWRDTVNVNVNVGVPSLQNVGAKGGVGGNVNLLNKSSRSSPGNPLVNLNDEGYGGKSAGKDDKGGGGGGVLILPTFTPKLQKKSAVSVLSGGYKNNGTTGPGIRKQQQSKSNTGDDDDVGIGMETVRMVVNPKSVSDNIPAAGISTTPKRLHSRQVSGSQFNSTYADENYSRGGVTGIGIGRAPGLAQGYQKRHFDVAYASDELQIQSEENEGVLERRRPVTTVKSEKLQMEEDVDGEGGEGRYRVLSYIIEPPVTFNLSQKLGRYAQDRKSWKQRQLRGY